MSDEGKVPPVPGQQGSGDLAPSEARRAARNGEPGSQRGAVAADELERALRFLHLVDAQTRARVEELSATVHAVLEVLVAEGVLPVEGYEKRKHLTVLRENERAKGEIGIEIADIEDKYALEDTPRIDCEARLELCQARCCRLPFALSRQDLDEGVLRWRYERPYLLARRPDGMCVHNDGGACDRYESRPGQCRLYDCRHDRRIWLDFEARIPAP